MYDKHLLNHFVFVEDIAWYDRIIITPAYENIDKNIIVCKSLALAVNHKHRIRLTWFFYRITHFLLPYIFVMNAVFVEIAAVF